MAEIRVPTLGESVTEATIGKWFKKPGEAVAVDEPLVELETDKVTIEVPAPAAGVLSDIAAKDGETVAVGALLGDQGGRRSCRCVTGAATKAPEPKAEQTVLPRRPATCRWHRRCANSRRAGVHPAKVDGSGKDRVARAT
jgi:2-oxoglutarate dehydrogenase E2 component (dihydrolipoamide succinyltransferase)